MSEYETAREDQKRCKNLNNKTEQKQKQKQRQKKKQKQRQKQKQKQKQSRQHESLPKPNIRSREVRKSESVLLFFAKFCDPRFFFDHIKIQNKWYNKKQ